MGLAKDLRFGARLLVKNPTFTLVAIMTLGLGIGASTAMFSVVNAIILKPLPFPYSDQLVQVFTQFPNQKFDRWALSPPEYFELRRDARSFQAVAAYQVAGAAIAARERPLRAPAAYTTASFATTVGVAPAKGRYFDTSEDLPGDVTAVVISHRLWQGAFAGDPDILSRRVYLDGMTVSVVGVMPEGFAYPQADTDLWIPMKLDPASRNRGNHKLIVIARLAPDVSVGRARAEAETLMVAWKAANSGHSLGRPNHPLVLFPLKDELIGSVRWTLWLLQAAVLFVLLIACANVSNLLLARAEARSREIAVRHALGASRRQLVRQFLVESLLLGLLGGVVGILLAVWEVDLTVSLLPAGAPRATEIHIDAWVLIFALAAAVLTSLAFGLAPIMHTRVRDLPGALKDGPRTLGSLRQRFRRALVVAEVALAVVLVVGCGLVIKSFVRLSRVETGFSPGGLVTGEVEIVEKSYPKDADALAFWERLADSLRAEPGVGSVTLMTGLPPRRRMNANDADFEGMTQSKQGPVFNIDFWQVVGDNFFTTMGMRLVRGRWLAPTDTADSEPVVVINEALARKFYPGQDPVGRRLKVAPWKKDSPWQTIVGVVADVKQQGLDAPTGSEVFIPLRQSVLQFGEVPRDVYVGVRGGVAPGALASIVRSVVNRLDASVPVYKLRTMDEVIYESVGKPRFITFLLGVFAGLALLLAAIGIYGVMSYSVAQRTRELGLRMALGARAVGVRRLVLGEGLLLAGVGTVLGLAAAFALNSALASRLAALLYDVQAVDPATFAGMAMLVLVVAAAACLVPAMRATRVDPMVALREE